MSTNGDIDKIIKDVLTKYKKIAVVGLSPETGRPSYGVSQYMKSCGYEITPVRPDGAVIFGVKSVPSLADVPRPVEIVDVFRKSEAVPEIVDEAIKAKAKVLWLQEGVFHPVAEQKARDAGIVVISDRCILKDHSRLF